MSESLTYDLMGNIASLNRDNQISKYNYNGNQLMDITDGGLATGKYAYDQNGNTVSDGRNGMTLSYNTLNLPTSASKMGVNINYQYDASGNKLSKTSINGANTSIRNYIQGIEYIGTTIDVIHTEEGLAQNNNDNYSYHYNLTDNLGNVRYTFQENPVDKKIDRLQSDDYYPFGLRKSSGSIVSLNNKYLYNGKELQDELMQYDYGARFYDPVIGRWIIVDPLSEKMRRHSPYNYGFNNPIRFVDPDGMAPNDWIEWRAIGGTKYFTYDAQIHTKSEALAKGYSNVNSVFASARGASAVTGEIFNFHENGKVSDGIGKSINISGSDFVTKGGNHIDKSLNGYEQSASVLQNSGDLLTATGIVSGQPELIIAGDLLGIVGLGIEVSNSFYNEGFNSETIMKNGAKLGINYFSGKLGEAGIKATKSVAGKAAVEAGANAVSETIIQGTTFTGGKVAEKLSEEVLKDK